MSNGYDDFNLGHATAYAYYKAGGGTMTEAEFTEFMADFGEAAQTAVEAAQAALASETAASTAAETATTKAGEAATSATAAAGSASTASAKATEATTAASTATTKAGEAASSATAAATAKTNAETAKTAADADALKAEGHAAGKQNGTAVSSNSPYYHNNAAYFADQAGDSADAAAASATAAAQSAASLTVDSALSSSSTNPVQNKVIDAEISALKEDLTRIEAIIPILAGRGKTWAEIKQNVKMGYGEILYPVGTDFSVDCPTGSPYDSIVWTVVDHRIENGEHIMTLLMKHVIYGLQFDAPQAIIVPDETMAAGTYHFKLLSGYDTTYDGGKSVQFTLANDLAAGGQIVMNWPYNQTWIGKNITVYDEFGTAVIETCVMSEGTGGTDLGDADGTVSILNHTQRARYGSNNYKESAMRDWLNSDNLAGQWQTQQTRFQRPCDYAANRAGFVTYLDPDFVAVIREGTHLNRTNEVFDLNGKKQAYSTTEKFFLPAQEEIGFSSESGIVCGTVFDFYNDAAQSDKIKYDITAQTTARLWWLRTPSPSYASAERLVHSSGALGTYFAYSGNGASAACEI